MLEVDAVTRDLALSGLVSEDIQARPIEGPERGALTIPARVEGYVIPYFTMDGRRIPYYRCKLIQFNPKYKQAPGSGVYVYFPPNFLEAIKGKNYVILTEGEKKAASCCKLGIPAAALSGVENYKNRNFVLPPDAEVETTKSYIKIRMPQGSAITADDVDDLAIGMQDLIDLIIKEDLNLIICYDTDGMDGIKFEVQKAAATMAFELRYRGIQTARIRQMILPTFPATDDIGEKVWRKIGLDDYIVECDDQGTRLKKLIQETLLKRAAFPRYPAIRDFINRRLQSAAMSRKDMQLLSTTVLTELDAGGIRLRSTSDNSYYYFDSDSKKLLKASLGASDENHHDAFGQFLYYRFGIGGADRKILAWINTHFTSEQPVEEVSPYKVIARRNAQEDVAYLQLTDGHYAQITAEGVNIVDNGDNGILFESGQVKPIDIPKLVKAYADQKDKPPGFWWGDVLKEVRLKDQTKLPILMGLLYYISPYLYRWRGMQLPIELMIGEPGSGKSTLYELRQMILTGQPKLRNAPLTLKDWHASIASTGGLHVTDNVQLADKQLRQMLSDEMCRIVTASEPSIEARQLYTNADLLQMPVRVVFALTAVQQPFIQQDLLQRALIVELDKARQLKDEGVIEYRPNWLNEQIDRFGGREMWVAHHLLVLHKFFQLVDKKWSWKYKSKHRLINFEQALSIMAQVFGIEHEWIPKYLTDKADAAIASTDWALRGLTEYAKMVREYCKANGTKKASFMASDLTEWAMDEEDFSGCDVLTDSKKLGRYLGTHRAQIGSMLGIVEDGTKNNRAVYRIIIPHGE